VKRGQEKMAAMCLMNKCIAMAKRGTPLSILSTTATENVEGYIYVEAFKEIHVREAIKGLSVILGGKVNLISIQEMPGIYQVNQKDI
jgi:transcription elongation factor SPT5